MLFWQSLLCSPLINLGPNFRAILVRLLPARAHKFARVETSDYTGIRTSHVFRLGLEPGSTAWKSRRLTTQPATHVPLALLVWEAHYNVVPLQVRPFLLFALLFSAFWLCDNLLENNSASECVAFNHLGMIYIIGINVVCYSLNQTNLLSISPWCLFSLTAAWATDFLNLRTSSYVRVMLKSEHCSMSFFLSRINVPSEIWYVVGLFIMTLVIIFPISSAGFVLSSFGGSLARNFKRRSLHASVTSSFVILVLYVFWSLQFSEHSSLTIVGIDETSPTSSSSSTSLRIWGA